MGGSLRRRRPTTRCANRVLAERAACQPRIASASFDCTERVSIGFKNAARFSRAFRAHFGYAPTGVQAADGRGAPTIDLARATPAKWLRTVLA